MFLTLRRLILVLCFAFICYKYISVLLSVAYYYVTTKINFKIVVYNIVVICYDERMKPKIYYNYLADLSKEQTESLAKELGTSVEMIRHYYSGYSSISAKRISSIIKWAKDNTPHHVPTFDQLLSISANKKGAA